MIEDRWVLWDVVGTLIEVAEPVEDVYQRVLRRRGVGMEAERLRAGFRAAFRAAPEPDFSASADGDLVERDWWRMIVIRTLREAGGDDLASDGGSFDEIFGHYASGDAWRVMDGAVTRLEALGRAGVGMAVVSNFDRRLHRVLGDLDLERHFQKVVTSADVGARKPSPLMIQRVLADCEIRREQAILVGDREDTDGAAAAAAGIAWLLPDQVENAFPDIFATK